MTRWNHHGFIVCVECDGDAEIQIIHGHLNDPGARVTVEKCPTCHGAGTATCV